MGATLDALHKLQGIERRLYALRQKIEAKKREIRVQSRKVDKGEKDDQEHHDKVKRLQMDIDRLELERKTREGEIVRLRELMKVTKTNKEYAALRVQINTLDANNRKLEDRILELMNQSDEFRKKADAVSENQHQQIERLDRLKQELTELEADTKPKMEGLQLQREEAALSVPASALQTFDRVSEHNDAEAMAPVVRPHPKREEFTCGGCHMSIPLQTVNALMNTDDVQTCDVCGRILYLEAPAATDSAAAS